MCMTSRKSQHLIPTIASIVGGGGIIFGRLRTISGSDFQEQQQSQSSIVGQVGKVGLGKAVGGGQEE